MYNATMSHVSPSPTASFPNPLPPRDRHAHKHQVGRVAVLAGDTGMEGAAWLTALGALRSGVGLVYLLATPTLMGQGGVPEVIKVPRPLHAPEWATVLDDMAPHSVVVGPGLSATTAGCVCAVIDWALSHQSPLVIDAGALGMVARFSPHPCMILTPHDGERRAHGWDPLPTAEWVMVAKGAPTTVTHPGGHWVCPVGNSGMASAGMGDVLSGVIGGVAAQYRDMPLSERVCRAVWAHSYAADTLAQRHPIGFLASDVAHALPVAWAAMGSHA